MDAGPHKGGTPAWGTHLGPDQRSAGSSCRGNKRKSQPRICKGSAMGRHQTQLPAQPQDISRGLHTPQKQGIPCHTQPIVPNAATGPHPPISQQHHQQTQEKAMYQLGSSLKWLVATMVDACGDPFAFSKLDIKDGFWRLVVHPDDAWNFCYVLPQTLDAPEDNILLVVPTALQMGWCERKQHIRPGNFEISK
eukprot:2459025-Ditylum_brightwellii.AAC.1